MREEELQKLFKSKLGNREFEYNPENWKAMESMLDRRKSRVGGFYWTSVGVILAFGVLVGSLTFLNPTPKEENTTQEAPSKDGPVHNLGEHASPKGEMGEKPETNLSKNVAESETASHTGTNSSKNPPIKTSLEKDTETDSGTKTASAENNPPSSVANVQQGGTSNNIEGFFSAKWKGLPRLPFTATDLPQKEISADFVPQSTPLPLRHDFFVNAGALISGSNKGSAGLGWTAGLFYQYRLSNRWAVGVGANYRVQNNVGATDRKDSVYYEFGRQYLEVEKTVQRLEYVEIPLTLVWQISPEQQIQAGVYAAQLVNVREEIRHKRHSKAPATTTVTKVSGIDPDLQKYDYGFSLGYRHKITPSLSLAVELRQGMTDITRNVSTDFNTVHQNLNAGVTLQYQLF